VVGLDASGAMLAVARMSAAAHPGRRPAYVQGSGAALPFRQAFDAVFSTATLHWIDDHDAVFRSVREALKPGGRLVAQCGGKGNLRRLLDRAAALTDSVAYAPYFGGWREPWIFADAESTAGRLLRAGFTEVETSLEDAPVELPAGPAYSEFVSCVCIRHHLDRLPLNLREPFVNELAERAARDAPPFVLDYRRLNISARRA
jgi:trans-aconitate 2-methyltransferase